MGSLTTICDIEKVPPEAWMTTPFGASSEDMKSTAGLTSLGCRSGSGSPRSSERPGTVLVMRVAAPGPRVLTRTLWLAPSRASTFMSPTMPIFAAP